MADTLGLAQGCVAVYSMSITQTKGHPMLQVDNSLAIQKEIDRQEIQLGYYLRKGSADQIAEEFRILGSLRAELRNAKVA